MLQSMKAKGQEEIAAFFSVLIFAAVFLAIVIFLSLASGNVKQEIISDFEDTDFKEALLTFIMSPTEDGRNMADVIVEMMNKEDAGKNPDDPTLRYFINATFDYFEYDPDLAYIIAVSDAEKDEAYYLFNNKERFEEKNKYFPIYFSRRGHLPEELEEVSFFIPNPYGKIATIKVSLVKIPIPKEIKFVKVEA